jgi:hypothetical protein
MGRRALLVGFTFFGLQTNKKGRSSGSFTKNQEPRTKNQEPKTKNLPFGETDCIMFVCYSSKEAFCDTAGENHQSP